jgi:CHAT domain-containing protein
MIFKPLRQSANFYVKSLCSIILILIPILCISNTSQEYPFEKSENILKADSLLFNELFKSAYEYYKKALSEYEIKEDWEGVAYTLNRMGWGNITAFNYKEGYELLLRSSEIIKTHNLQPSHIMADNFLFRGIYFNRKTEEFDSAIYWHQKDIELRKELSGDRSELLAESYRHYAQCLADFGNLALGEKYLRESINIFEDYYPPTHIIFGRCYGTLSSILRKRYDYENAVLYAEKSLDIFKNSSDDQAISIVTSQITLANIHNHFKIRDKALIEYNKTKEMLISSPEINIEYLIYYFYLNLASLLNRIEMPDSTLYYTDIAMDLLSEHGLDDVGWTTWFDLISGEAFALKGDFQEAKKLAKNTLRVYNQYFSESITDLAVINQTLGRIYEEELVYDSAIFYFQEALIYLIPEFDNIDFNSNPTHIGSTEIFNYYDLLYDKADALRKFYFKSKDEKYLMAAMEVYNIIDKINDETRNSKMAEGSLLAINEFYQAEYEKGIDSAMELYNLTGNTTYISNAFQLMEKSKYMLLFKSLATTDIFDDTNISTELKQIEDSLKSEYVNSQLLIEIEENKENPNNVLLEELNARKSEFGIALDNFKLQVQDQYPNYAEIKYDTLLKSFEEFKGYCTENNILGLEFYWGVENIYLISTASEGQQFFKYEKSEDFEHSLSQFLYFLTNEFSMSSSVEDYQHYTESAYKIFHKILMQPLKDAQGYDELLIIPDGKLSQMPFEALITSEIDDDYVDYQGLPYLIKAYQAGYAYSANLLLSEKRIEKESKNNLLAFSYSSIESSNQTSGRSEGEDELQHSAIELRAVRKEMGRRKSKYYYDQKATEHQFKTDASDYQLIHLAVHGETDTASAMNSKLVFKNELDEYEDGQLFMHELYGLDLSNTELAVLSACETGIGKTFSGEGVFSMARGFAYAGCPTIVMSLWKVNDKYTAELMTGFYKILNKKNNIVESLTNSKRAFISNSDEYKAHPSNWAAFITVGKNPVIVKRSYTVYYVIALMLTVSLYLIYTRFRKKHQNLTVN